MINLFKTKPVRNHNKALMKKRLDALNPRPLSRLDDSNKCHRWTMNFILLQCQLGFKRHSGLTLKRKNKMLRTKLIKQFCLEINQ